MKKNIKKTLALLLSVLLIAGCLSISSFAAGEKFTFSLKNGYAVLTSCSKDANGIVSVPSMATINGNGYEVKYIGASAFAGCNKITQISIPEGITVIGSKAFYGCKALTDLYVPSTLASCQYDAFDDCNSVTVHCYSTNYQFFTVYGFSENISIDILDSDDDSGFIGGESEEDKDIVMSIVDVFRNFILRILDYFGANPNEEDKFLEGLLDKLMQFVPA